MKIFLKLFKISLTLTLLLSFFTIDNFVSAQTLTPKTSEGTPSGNLIEKLKKIEELKEKIATKVAQIREKDKVAFFGIVKTLSSSSLTLSTTKKEQNIKISEDTVFYSLKTGNKIESTAKSLKEGEYLTVFGYRNEDNETVAAKYVYLQNPLTQFVGKIANIDKSNFTITVKNNGTETVVDFEKTTKASLYDRKREVFATIGFSKIQVGDFVHIIASSSGQKENRVSAKKIFILSFFKQSTITATPFQPESSSPSVSIIKN